MSASEQNIKLFNKWSFNNIEIKDHALEKYINLRPVIIPHSCGKHEHKKFWKSQKVTIVERFINRLLSPGFIANKIKGHKSAYQSGKKAKLMRTVKTAFIIIEQATGENPIQILIDAIVYASPREETTRITMGGISYASSVDISPQRRVDLALKYLVQAIATRTMGNIGTFEEGVAQELITAAKNSQDSKAIKRKDELERIATSAR